MADKPQLDPDSDYINICGGDRDLPPKKRPRDANQLAKMIVDLSTGDETESDVSPKARAGQLGGLKGGKARAEKLTPEERSAIAKKAAESRWSKND